MSSSHQLRRRDRPDRDTPSRLCEWIKPSVEDVLRRYGAAGIVPVEALARAVIEGLVDTSPRLKARERIIVECGGAPTCWICGLPIPMDAAPDTPERFSIDHVVPKEDGGAILGFENLKPAHRLCNSMRDVPTRHAKCCSGVNTYSRGFVSRVQLERRVVTDGRVHLCVHAGAEAKKVA